MSDAKKTIQGFDGIRIHSGNVEGPSGVITIQMRRNDGDEWADVGDLRDGELEIGEDWEVTPTGLRQFEVAEARERLRTLDEWIGGWNPSGSRSLLAEYEEERRNVRAFLAYHQRGLRVFPWVAR